MDLDRHIRFGYLEGKGGGGPAVVMKETKVNDEAGDARFLEYIKNIRSILEGEREIKKSIEDVEELKEKAKTIRVNRQLQKEIKESEKSCKRTLKLWQDRLHTVLKLMDAEENREHPGKGEKGKSMGLAMLPVTLVTESGSLEQLQNPTASGIVDDASSAVAAVKENNDENEEKDKKKRDSATEFIENYVRPQKAKKEEVDRFCRIVQDPEVFKAVKDGPKLLAMDR